MDRRLVDQGVEAAGVVEQHVFGGVKIKLGSQQLRAQRQRHRRNHEKWALFGCGHPHLHQAARHTAGGTSQELGRRRNLAGHGHSPVAQYQIHPIRIAPGASDVTHRE